MRIAIAGLGHVGAAVVRLLCAHADRLAARSGQEIILVAVSARDRGKKRDCDLAGVDWVDDARALAARGDIDVVVELMGGADGVAYELAQAVLASGKHLVTGNKAMMAAHGVELAGLAEKSGVALAMEAAVCGGVPVIKLLREGMAANRVSGLRGILNGTCNYILTRMGEDGMDFDAALAEAQGRGFAEANPAADIDGYDSANKLALLSALAFSTAPDMGSIFIEGIRHITQADLNDAAARGGRIKLLGIASRLGDGVVVQRVQPVFVPLDETIARVGGHANILQISGDFAGDILIQGIGAGGDVTASAIVADLVDVARGQRGCAFGVPAASLISPAGV
ncbi:MAG: homoserine dehydrogenase [Alphaproteobacteria bacterium]|nr:homoserine dehydrogenase [Alphaproteobacteria bacterium]